MVDSRAAAARPARHNTQMSEEDLRAAFERRQRTREKFDTLNVSPFEVSCSVKIASMCD